MIVVFSRVLIEGILVAGFGLACFGIVSILIVVGIAGPIDIRPIRIVSVHILICDIIISIISGSKRADCIMLWVQRSHDISQSRDQCCRYLYINMISLEFILINLLQTFRFIYQHQMQSTQSQSQLQSQVLDGPEEQYKHMNARNQYTIYIVDMPQSISIRLTQKFTLFQWKTIAKKDSLVDISKKTGFELSANKFVEVLKKALSQREIDCYIDILTSEDLENLKNKKSGVHKKSTEKQSSSASNKRYLILTYMTNQNKFHYPISLNPTKLELPMDKLKQIYNDLRVELEAARTSALNDTQKSQSFSINYINEKNRNNKNLSNVNKLKQIDQVKSENQILKAKLARLQEQAEKKKANIEIEAAIQRTKLLKQSIETANLELVDWKNNIQDQQETHIDLKKQLSQLHKKICSLLQTQKEVAAKKKGEEVEKQLTQVKNTIKKNNNQIEKLKKQLEVSKVKIKELEIKAKKLNSEKEVIRKGRKGPYSSAGSVRSYNSFNSFNSAGKRSTGSNASSNSKTKSNYSYNSYSYNKRR